MHLFVIEEVDFACGAAKEQIGKCHKVAKAVAPISYSLKADTVVGKAAEVAV